MITLFPEVQTVEDWKPPNITMLPPASESVGQESIFV